MILAVTFGDDNFSLSRDYNLKSALKYGHVDKVKKYTPNDLDPAFSDANREILSAKRGAGYWLWKPYIINKAFKELKKGDYLVYADSGSFYKRDVYILVKYMEQNKMVVFLNELKHKEGEYSKRDAFVYMDVDDLKLENTYQYEASFLLIKKETVTEQFLKDWLHYACDRRIISDDANTCGLLNYNGFVENRYDQTVLSLLAKKYNFKGNFPADMPRLRKKYKKDYPQIVIRTRYRNTSIFKFSLKILYKHLEYYWLNFIGIRNPDEARR